MKKTTIKIIGAEGAKETVAVPTRLKDVKPNPNLVAQYVRVYLKNQRQGTASTKDRSQIIGTTKKMYKQKGTGNARHASAKAPIFVGGGVVGGPKPRDYSVRMNQKQKVMALDSALVARIQEEKMWVIASEKSKNIVKTKDFAVLLKSIDIAPGSKFTFIVDGEKDKSISKSARNIDGANIVNVQNVNAYDVLRGKALILSQLAFSSLSK